MLIALAGCGGGGGGSAKATQGNGSPSSNAAPSIGGQPGADAQAGQAYSFQPSAQDPEGAALQFSVTNLPSWATFDASTGRISGSPPSSAVGSYSGVVISVSDGVNTARLGPFSINVVALSTGVATISWTPPNSNTDGSALTDLTGYVVLYGRSADNLSQSIEIDNASMSTYVVESLATGTWYFAVVSVNAEGIRSALSNVTSKTV
ncbi:MAG TPA: putative Ig domain-containing protein [Steroidobacteraceae bacterium]|nr:putative Ig domain-containing protein [Steroidobacteraceae bacterium]